MTAPHIALAAAVAVCWAAAALAWWVTRHIRRRNRSPVRVSPRWADQLTRDPQDDRDRRGRRRWPR